MKDSYNRELLAYPASETEAREYTVRELLRQDAPPDYYGILDMLFTFTGMTISVLLILFVDLAIGIPVCIILYGAIVWGEIVHKIYSPVSISLVILYCILYFFFLSDSPYLPYFGLIVFGWLTLLCAVLMLLKKPMTLFYTPGLGILWFHYLNSGIWLGAFFLCFVSSLWLMPSIWYLIVPFLICFAVCLITIYLNFFDTRFITKRQIEYSIGKFTFRQFDPKRDNFEEYANFFAGLLAYETFQAPEKFEPLKGMMHYRDTEAMPNRPIFLAFYNGKMVGCLAQAIDIPGENFEFESLLGCSFNPLRKFGVVANRGRFGIAKEFRENPDVLIGLAKGVIEVSLENDVAFIVSEVLPGRSSSFHSRIGSTPLLNRNDPCHAVELQVLGKLIIYFNNFASLIYYRKKEVENTFGFTDHINELFAERWIKRMVVRHAFSKPENRPWLHTIKSVRTLLCINMPAE